jgi:RNA polymerase sigma-70 factor (ECF subfamily)
LISYLSARSGDVAGAEDALSDALLAALRSWNERGVPDKPEAWLLAAARRRMLDQARHQRVRSEASLLLRSALSEAEQLASSSGFPDERLKLLFVCAHPAIDDTLHTPLMLQAVLGLDAAIIAKAFLSLPATMGQRLSRAKAKIREANITFSVPSGPQLPARLDAVLSAVYAAYGSGWDDHAGSDPRRRGLTDEALWLARVTLACLPEEPEAAGLLALLLYCEARRAARRSKAGAYVPIADQDTSLWSVPMLEEAERLLAHAARARRIGRFQLEAAIQSAHVERMRGGTIDWRAIALLYQGLLREAPTLGAHVGQAAAVAQAEDAAAGLRLLDQLEPELVREYQPYWAARAHLLRLNAQPDASRDAYSRAIALSPDPAVRQFLTQRMQQAR